MTEFEAPDWFCEMFGRTSLDWVRDLERIDNATIVPGEIHPSLQQRADQLWLAVVAHQPSSPASATAVDSVQPVHPYEPAVERPSMRERMGQTMADLNEPGVTSVARLGFPEPAIPSTPPRSEPLVGAPLPIGAVLGWDPATEDHRPVPPRSEALRNYAPGMFVTREATVNVAPKVDCPECGGNGQIPTFATGDDPFQIPCHACDGSGLVAAPPSVPRETGAAPEDSELLRPLTVEERAVIESEQAPPDVVAAQVAAARSGLDRMKRT